MIPVNNQCEYAVYAAAATGTENHSYLDYDLPLGMFFNYYPNTVEYKDAPGKNDSSNSDFVHLGMTALDDTYLADIYYRRKVLPLFPEDWRDRLPATTTFHIIYNRELLNNKDYSANAMYGCVYIQYVGNGNYVRLDKYLNVEAVPILPDAGTDIYFLYGLGQNIFLNLHAADILNLNINGVTFMEILFSGGIVVYCTWVIVKWVIGLS